MIQGDARDVAPMREPGQHGRPVPSASEAAVCLKSFNLDIRLVRPIPQTRFDMLGPNQHAEPAHNVAMGGIECDRFQCSALLGADWT